MDSDITNKVAMGAFVGPWRFALRVGMLTGVVYLAVQYNPHSG